MLTPTWILLYGTLITNPYPPHTEVLSNKIVSSERICLIEAEKKWADYFKWQFHSQYTEWVFCCEMDKNRLPKNCKHIVCDIGGVCRND